MSNVDGDGDSQGWRGKWPIEFLADNLPQRKVKGGQVIMILFDAEMIMLTRKIFQVGVKTRFREGTIPGVSSGTRSLPWTGVKTLAAFLTPPLRWPGCRPRPRSGEHPHSKSRILAPIEYQSIDHRGVCSEELNLKGKLGDFFYLFKVFIGPKLRQV